MLQRFFIYCQVDEKQFSKLVSAMQRPTAPTKKYKSKNKKTYDVNILLPAPKIKRRRLGTLPTSDSKIAPMKTEDISAPEAVIVEASNDDLVLTVKQSVVDVLLETNDDQEWDEQQYLYSALC